MICENLHLSVEQVMAELDISRATIFGDCAKIRKATGAMYDKKHQLGHYSGLSLIQS